MQHIAIVDCDHVGVDEEMRVAAEHQVVLTRAQALSDTDIVAAAGDAEGIITQYARITAQVMDALPALRVIGRYGVGVDTIDVAAATERGIAVCNVPDYGTEDVSDHAIALIAAAARAVAPLDRAMRAGEHTLDAARPLHRFRELTVGVVGLGAIGRALGRKALALGFHVIGFDTAVAVGDEVDGIAVVEWHALLAQSDVVSLHIPLVPATHHLIDDAVLGLMKPGVILVNTCRGGVIDTDALVRALDDGRVRTAALDVFEVEPLPVGHPLLLSPRTVLTPHAGWYSEESYRELKTRIAVNVISTLRGDPRNVVNAAVLAASN